MSDTTHLLSQVYVKVNGQDAAQLTRPQGELASDIMEITVDSSMLLPDVATLVLHDPHLNWIDDSRLAPGKVLTIAFKIGDQTDTVFDGEIVELEPDFSPSTQQLTVRAFDRLHRLARGKLARTFVNVNDGDLVSKIAGEVGLQAKHGPTTTVFDHVFQRNETNLEFLQSRAAAVGYVLWVEGTTLHFDSPSSQTEVVATLEWGNSLSEFHPRLTTVGQEEEVTVRGWDPKRKQAIIGHATSGQSAPAVGDKQPGGQVATTAFFAAKGLVTNRPVSDQTLAGKMAQGHADRNSGRFIEADGVGAGNPKIVSGRLIQIQDVGKSFSGKYLVTSATHHYSAEHGYSTKFGVSGHHPSTLLSLLSPDAESSHSPHHSDPMIGVVTDCNDPEKQGRVKVMYPSLSDSDTSFWARVVAPGAGNDRGIAFLPEVNDEVLVCFEHGDIHYPYVLGGLWNGKDKLPSKAGELVSGGKVMKRCLESRTGHAIWFDDADDGGGITIQDSKGNKVVVKTSDSSMTAEVTGNVTIKSKGNVSVEAQGNASIKATGSVAINGNGVTIDAGGGNVTVKGIMISLN